MKIVPAASASWKRQMQEHNVQHGGWSVQSAKSWSMDMVAFKVQKGYYSVVQWCQA